ncbi:hypothetical protein LY01_01760 [Nonlabens xylanidelens]|uniref:Glycerophosphoryl diester phosphodiesterase family protein n=1 Tax=Nonlabens xylanidelens TaxID=191564 RepID=A0A2S6IL96_9FLAO|nr:hypothetical protein [Nonlabens xylanidelens]PPK95007.1 hypothetical protein LY01_01760 [Nonlabens xylanidelens]PQJ17548.1 hypothetical protein BST94_10870 [Nonlabens xylanidelens]
MNNYIEPRLRRDFGGVITAYFDFLKGDHKNLFKVFLTYNFIFIIILFITNYIANSGLSSVVALANGTYMDQAMDGSLETSYIASGIGIVINIIVILLNASLAGVYLRLYERDREGNPNYKEVFHYAKKKLGGMFLIVLIGGIAFIPIWIVIVICAITVVGIIAIPLILIAYATWVGLSMFAFAYDEHMDAVAALGKGWEMLFSKFWKAVGVSFVTSILIYLASTLFQLLPVLIVTFYGYNSAEDNVELESNIFIKAVEFFFYAINSILGSLTFFLIMLVMGYLYFNLHETKYNVFLKNRIAKLGVRDEE